MPAQLLDSLTEDGQRRVRQRCGRVRFRAGAYIFHAGEAGDTLHMIQSGRVMVLAGGSLGEPLTLAILGPGETFGELALFSTDHRRTATIQTLDRTETLLLHRDDFEDLRRSHPGVDRFFVGLLASQVTRLTLRQIELSEMPAPQRIYRRIADLGKVFEASGTDHPMVVSQQQLASMAGVHLRVTSTVLNKAKQDGVLAVGRRKLSVLDWRVVFARAGLKPA